jgi:hypothetical protein
MAKGIRRDLRRAVGEAAVEGLTSATNAINHAILPNLNAVQSRLHHLEQGDDRMTDQYVRLAENVRAIRARVAWFEDLTFWGRLRWLLRGQL